MKKYIIFSISFLILYVIFQVVSGYVLTLFYTPDIMRALMLDPDTRFIVTAISSLITTVFAFIAATIAFFIPRLFIKKASNI